MKTGRKQHSWNAVCDEKGNQIGDLIYCDRCGKTFHMSQVDSITGDIRKDQQPVDGYERYGRRKP